MRPDTTVIKAGVPEGASAQALMDEGRAYAVYLLGGRQANLVLALPGGAYMTHD